MTPASQWYVRRWTLALVVLLAWIGLSLGCSWLLVNHAFRQDIRSRILSDTEHLARLARGHLQSTEAATSRPGFDPENSSDLQADVESARILDPHIAYAMIWTEDGRILAHSRGRDLFHTNLDSTLWPALDSHQASRISQLTVPDYSKDPHVLEATVPLKLREKTVAYVSLAFPEDWINEEFWRSQGQVLVLAGGFTLAGLVALFLIIHFTIARLDRRRQEAQQTARARTSLLTERGMLASVLAHEVRSPLTALRFNLHSLRTLIASQTQGDGQHSPGPSPAKAGSDRQLELTDRCEREIRRLDGMLNDFLQRTQVIGPVESASVNTVVSEAMEFLRPALERKHVHISIHLDSSDALVHVHPDELRQVILNLATNAHEAMPKGGTLAVSTLAEQPPLSDAPVAPNGSTGNGGRSEGTVTILIRDSGTGIPPDLHERIFEPFFSTKPSGSGLGLALVRRVISGAGGSVTCDSIVNEGTTFRIVLPRAEADAERPIPPGHGYAHIRRDDPALAFDESPEIVIDLQDQKSEEPSPSESP